MVADLSQDPNYALQMLGLFPESIRQSLIKDKGFCEEYGLKVDIELTLGDDEVTFQRSKLFQCIRETISNDNVQNIVKDQLGRDWSITYSENNNKRDLILSHGEKKFILPAFYYFYPDKESRLKGFKSQADEVNLPDNVIAYWSERLGSNPLSDDDIDELESDIEETPIRFIVRLREEIEKGESSLELLVPRSKKYYECLVGKLDKSLNIIDYAKNEAQKHFSKYLFWNPSEGFSLSLLLSSHSLNAYSIQVEELNDEELTQVFEWLEKKGDIISKVGAIEVGLSIIDKKPFIASYIEGMIRFIKDDRPEDQKGRLQLLSSLILFVDGEISRIKVLSKSPPFWRRLASIAHASLIERYAIELGVDIASFGEWAAEVRGRAFFLQTMSDLRAEPRWYPQFASSQQLKAEFIGRIFSAANNNDSKIKIASLRRLIFDESAESIQSQMVFPYPYLPGPLEGDSGSQNEPPQDIIETIEAQLSEHVLKPESFTTIVNSALIFRLDLYHAQLAAKALRTIKYQIMHDENKEHLLTILQGLASVAAVTRSKELADELRILTRRCRLSLGSNISVHEAMIVGLISAASHSELNEWCEFVGEWITELAFQSLESDEMEILHSNIEQLCELVPELWRTCSRAEAGLSAVINANLPG